MRATLKHLSFKPYHSADLIENWERDVPLWEEAITAKFEGSGQQYGQEQFDAIFAAYDVSGAGKLMF